MVVEMVEMTEIPFLILHKVRGQPAFDIAIQMECPVCKEKWEHEDWECGACGDDKVWWIIPTSGHRAYPYWHFLLAEVDDDIMVEAFALSIPDDHPDHFGVDNSPTPYEPQGANALLNSLGLSRASKLVRRV